MVERFAEIDGSEVRKAMQKHYEDQDRLKPRVKKILETANLLQNIIDSYSNRASLEQERMVG